MIEASAPRDPRGFTLIELMVVVAIVAVLAGIAIPAFMSDSRRAHGSSETSAMLTEFSVKEQQYKSDNGAFLAVPACPGTPSPTPQSITGCISSASWTALRIAATSSTLACSYQVVTGLAGANPNGGLPAPITLPASPASSWFYVLATCDTDGKPALNSSYLMSNLDATIQKANEGN